MSGFPKVGDRFGGYEITGVIGHGGMGIVFAALQQGLNRPVALKVLDPKFADDPEFATRFAREAETLASMDSPHVIQVFDHGTVDGCLYLATQWVAGGDLAAYLTQHGPLPSPLAIDLAAQIASALADAHARGVIHRDVKPSNVLLARTGQDLFAYLCDFGIAQGQQPCLTQTGLLAGSLAFTAPERHQAHPATERSDLYSLGCLLWVVLTGSNPYEGTDFQIANQHLTAPIPRLREHGQVEHGLNGVLARLMAKDPRERPGSALEVVTELRQLARLAQGVLPVEVSGVAASPAGWDVTHVRQQLNRPMLPGYLPNTAGAMPSPASVLPPSGGYQSDIGDTVFSGAGETRKRSSLTSPPSAALAPGPSSPTRQLSLVVGAVVLALVVAGAGLWIWRAQTIGAAAARPGQSATATASSPTATASANEPLPPSPTEVEPRSPAFSHGPTIPLKGRAAHAVAVDPGSRRAFVTNYHSGTVSVINLKSGKDTRRLLGGQSGCVEPESVAVSQAAQRLLVTCGGSRKLFVFDLGSLAEPTAIDIKAGPSRVAVNETAGKAYVVSRHASQLMVIDLADPTSTPSSIRVGGAPWAVAVDEQRQIAYVSHWDSDKVSVVDVKKKKELSHVTVGRNPNGLAVAPEAGLVIVPNYGASVPGQRAPTAYSVDLISVKTHRKVTTIKMKDKCQRPGRVAVDEPAGVAYVTCQNSDKLAVIDLSSRVTIRWIGVPERPTGVAVDTTTGNVLVTSFAQSTVQLLHN